MGKWYRTIDDSIGAGADEESLFTSGWRVGRQTTNFVKLHTTVYGNTFLVKELKSKESNYTVSISNHRKDLVFHARDQKNFSCGKKNRNIRFRNKSDAIRTPAPQSDGFILHVSVMPLTMRYAGPWVHRHAMSLPELKLRHSVGRRGIYERFHDLQMKIFMSH
jgi:hypothetical protein